jgi:hypothetical protein
MEPDWRPWDLTRRRTSHQIFTPVEERETSQRILEEISTREAVEVLIKYWGQLPESIVRDASSVYLIEENAEQ